MSTIAPSSTPGGVPDGRGLSSPDPGQGLAAPDPASGGSHPAGGGPAQPVEERKRKRGAKSRQLHFWVTPADKEQVAILAAAAGPGVAELLEDVDKRDTSESKRLKVERASAEVLPWGRAYFDASEYVERWGRYEASIRRGITQGLHELQRLQAARAGEAVAPPLVLDIDGGGFESQNKPQ